MHFKCTIEFRMVRAEKFEEHVEALELLDAITLVQMLWTSNLDSNFWQSDVKARSLKLQTR